MIAPVGSIAKGTSRQGKGADNKGGKDTAHENGLIDADIPQRRI